MRSAEQADHRAVESRDIVGTAARDQSLINDRFLVGPVGASVAKIDFERRPFTCGSMTWATVTPIEDGSAPAAAARRSPRRTAKYFTAAYRE